METNQSNQISLASVVGEITALPEFKFYWQQYKSLSLQHPEKFAALKVSGECIENSLGELGSNIGLLHALGLYPVIVHGYGKA
ncbi:hypothetical protein HYX09_03610, partial [Candidatus Woesearchaeota archaeon]|nr:hypothetical protein [Candidatus Woesearchaeota archaeon]